MKQRVPLSLVKPGMVLARPVARDGGMVLLAEGTVLGEAAIARLASIHVESVVVRGNPLGGPGESLEKKEARLGHLFRKHAQDPWMSRMKSFLIQYYRSRLSPPQTPPAGT